MEMLQVVAAILLVLLLTGLIVIANRGLRAQRGSGLKRTPDEDRHVGRVNVSASQSDGA